MSVTSVVHDLAVRMGQEIKAVRAELASGLSGKANSTHTHTAVQISDSTTVGRAVIVAADGAAARSAIGAGTGSSNLALGSTGTTAAAGNHTHTAAAVGAVANVSGATGMWMGTLASRPASGTAGVLYVTW